MDNNQFAGCLIRPGIGSADDYIAFDAADKVGEVSPTFSTSTTTTEDSADKRFIWNEYNAVERPLLMAETTTRAAVPAQPVVEDVGDKFKRLTEDLATLMNGLPERAARGSITSELLGFYEIGGGYYWCVWRDAGKAFKVRVNYQPRLKRPETATAVAPAKDVTSEWTYSTGQWRAAPQPDIIRELDSIRMRKGESPW